MACWSHMDGAYSRSGEKRMCSRPGAIPTPESESFVVSFGGVGIGVGIVVIGIGVGIVVIGIGVGIG